MQSDAGGRVLEEAPRNFMKQGLKVITITL